MSETPPILLVEDNDDDAELTFLALGSPSLLHPLRRVRDGAEALDFLFGRGPFAAANPPGLPVVVLLDLRTPRVSGLEVLKALRADGRTRTLPVIVLSNSHWDQEQIIGHGFAPIAFSGKPVDLARVADAARSLGLILWREQ
ncbi:MAG: response regulator [Thermoanaerobaculia bacterium]|nr:response regulator [Thermoanaerobaculia bacterium]